MLKVIEALHINSKKPNLNTQQNQLAFTLSSKLASPVCLLLFWFFTYLFHLLFSLSVTLTIGIFYCLNQTLLLVHLIITHLVLHRTLSSIIFIIYDTNCWYLLHSFLHFAITSSHYNTSCTYILQ